METEYVRCMVRTGSWNISQINHLKMEKSGSTVLLNAARCPKERCFRKIPRLRPFFLLVKEICIGHWWNDTGRNLTCVVVEDSPYCTVNTLRFGYKNQLVNAVEGNNRCSFWCPYGTHLPCVLKSGVSLLACVVDLRIITATFWRANLRRDLNLRAVRLTEFKLVLLRLEGRWQTCVSLATRLLRLCSVGGRWMQCGCGTLVEW